MCVYPGYSRLTRSRWLFDGWASGGTLARKLRNQKPRITLNKRGVLAPASDTQYVLNPRKLPKVLSRTLRPGFSLQQLITPHHLTNNPPGNQSGAGSIHPHASVYLLTADPYFLMWEALAFDGNRLRRCLTRLLELVKARLTSHNPLSDCLAPTTPPLQNRPRTGKTPPEHLPAKLGFVLSGFLISGSQYRRSRRGGPHRRWFSVVRGRGWHC